MSWHFLQEQEAASWEGSSLDGAPFALLRLMPTVGAFCLPDSGTESLSPSRSGTTSEPSTEGRGAKVSTSSVVDSHARTLAPAGNTQASMASEADSGRRCEGSFLRYDPAASSWRTAQRSLLAGLDEFSATFPRWGFMRDGACWELATPGFLTSESASGLLPTPTKSWGRRGPGLSNNAENLRMSAESTALALRIVAIVGWRWPVSFIEWMMGWPTRWTALAPLETDKFRQWLASHGRS